MRQKLLISFFILTGLFYNNIGFSQTTNNQIIQGPYKTSLYPEGKIYFQKTNDFENPISFIVDYNVDGKNIKYIVDKYSHEGAAPEIKSVFFGTIHHKQYIFVMIVWSVNHSGIGMRGNVYQIYAYAKNNKGILSLDKQISNDDNLSGMDGYENCKAVANPDGVVNCAVSFKYKTAAEVKKYLKQTYH